MAQSQDAGTALAKALKAGIGQKLYDNRTIVVCGEIDSDLARSVVEKLLAMSTDSNQPITMYLHSPGGHVESADTLYDMLGFLPAPVRMIGTGWVASAGAHIFLAVPTENRYCLRWEVEGAARPTWRSRRSKSSRSVPASTESSPRRRASR